LAGDALGEAPAYTLASRRDPVLGDKSVEGDLALAAAEAGVSVSSG
jgi:hypothetical protein